MKRIYFLARLGSSDYLYHASAWDCTIDHTIERLENYHGVRVSIIDSVVTDTNLGHIINRELADHKVSSTVLHINTAAPIHDILEKYDGETIDPGYIPPKPLEEDLNLDDTNYEDLGLN